MTRCLRGIELLKEQKAAAEAEDGCDQHQAKHESHGDAPLCQRSWVSNSRWMR